MGECPCPLHGWQWKRPTYSAINSASRSCATPAEHTILDFTVRATPPATWCAAPSTWSAHSPTSTRSSAQFDAMSFALRRRLCAPGSGNQVQQALIDMVARGLRANAVLTQSYPRHGAAHMESPLCQSTFAAYCHPPSKIVVTVHASKVGLDLSRISPPLSPEERSLLHELYLMHNVQARSKGLRTDHSIRTESAAWVVSTQRAVCVGLWHTWGSNTGGDGEGGPAATTPRKGGHQCDPSIMFDSFLCAGCNAFRI
jgi:hypothetical protein